MLYIHHVTSKAKALTLFSDIDKIIGTVADSTILATSSGFHDRRERQFRRVISEQLKT